MKDAGAGEKKKSAIWKKEKKLIQNFINKIQEERTVTIKADKISLSCLIRWCVQCDTQKLPIY